jgi:hypothetical protein
MRITSKCSEGANEELERAENAWRILIDPDSDQDNADGSGEDIMMERPLEDHSSGTDEQTDLDEPDEEEEWAEIPESEGDMDQELEEQGGSPLDRDDSAVEKEVPAEKDFAESLNKIRKRWEGCWQAGIRYYIKVGSIEGDEDPNDSL